MPPDDTTYNWHEYAKSVKKTERTDESVRFSNEVKITVRRKPKISLTQDGKHSPRIDLHGMTESEAYDKLLSSFSHLSKNHVKRVIVITGKGYKLTPFGTEATGILRSQFERWAAHSELSVFVDEISIAKPSDGGGGAFYVKLKNLNKAVKSSAKRMSNAKLGSKWA